jgi:hypothetical protein
MDIEELISIVSERLRLNLGTYLTVDGKLPKGFPCGELMCVNCDGHKTYLFPSDKLLEWCNKQRDGLTNQAIPNETAVSDLLTGKKENPLTTA